MPRSERAHALASSPLLPRHLAELQALLADEAQRRTAFRDAVTPSDKADFINGTVIVHSPALARHVRTTRRIGQLLSAYVQRHRLGEVTIEKAMVTLTRNDYEPDVAFFGRDKAETIGGDTLFFPAPDLVVEVLSASTEARDRGVKREDYAAHGVSEYWLVDPLAETVEQLVLAGDAYELRAKQRTGRLESVAVQGFTADVRAFFDDAVSDAAMAAVYAGCGAVAPLPHRCPTRRTSTSA